MLPTGTPRSFGVWFARFVIGAGLVVAGAHGAAAIAGAAGSSTGTTLPVVSTAIHNAAHAVVTKVTAGTTVHDSVSVSGSLGTPTGSVSVRFFPDGTCTGTPLATSPTMVLAGGAADLTTLAPKLDVPGSYSFLATYFGDATYAPRTGGCEPLVVGKATPVVKSAVHNASHKTVTSVLVTSTVHDAVTVSGPASTPTGTVAVSFFSNGTCLAPARQTSAATVLVSGAVDVTAFTQTLNGAGSFSFQATYGGDTTYTSGIGPCEPITAVKATPTMTSAWHDPNHVAVSTIDIGRTAHNSIALVGTLGVPTGTVTTTEYANSLTCSGTGTQVSRSLDASGLADPGGVSINAPFPTIASFRATYSGDTRYAPVTGPCKSIAWKATATMTPSLTVNGQAVTTAPLLSTMVVSVSVTGSFTAPTGTATLTIYSGATCSAAPVVSFTFFDLSGAASFGPQVPRPAGTYSWQATYSGDGSYFPITGPCAVLTVTKLVAFISTQVHDVNHHFVTSAPIFSQVHAFGTAIGGAIVPTGSVHLKVFVTGNCQPLTSNFSATGTLVSGAADIVNGPFTESSPGSYSLQLEYSGDAFYDSALSPCQPFTFTKAASPTFSTVVQDATNTTVSSVPAGAVVHPLIEFPQFGELPTGTVSIAFFSNGSCSGVSTTATVPITGGTVDATSVTHALSVPGTYAFQATFGGDFHYLPGTGPCASVVALAPNATPPPNPTAGPAPTPAPGSTPAPGTTSAPGSSLLPLGSAAPAPVDSLAPGESGAPTTGPGASGGLLEGSPAAAADGLPVLVIGAALIGVALLGLAVTLRRRRRGAPTTQA